MNDRHDPLGITRGPSLRERLAAAAVADGLPVATTARRLLESALDPAAPLSNSDKLVHGVDAQRHPRLGFIVERGVGSLPIEAQAELFIRDVAKSHGEKAADVLRRELKEQTP